MGAPFALDRRPGAARPSSARSSPPARTTPQGVTISTAFVFAILFYWGPWPALLVHGPSAILARRAGQAQAAVARSSSTPGSTSICLWVAAGSALAGRHRPSPATSRSATSRCTRLPVMAPVLGRLLRGQPGAGRHGHDGLRTGRAGGTTSSTTSATTPSPPSRCSRSRRSSWSSPATSWGLIPLLLPAAVPRLQDRVHLAREGARGAPRRPDRARQPQAPGHPDGAGGRGERPHRPRSGPVPARPRPLQGDQRHPRPPRRRPAARDRRRPAVARRPARGHRRPARR